MKKIKKDCRLCTKYIQDSKVCRISGEYEPIPCDDYVVDFFLTGNKKITKQIPNENVKKIERYSKTYPAVCLSCKYWDTFRHTCRSVGYVYNDKCDYVTPKDRPKTIKQKVKVIETQLNLF